MTLSTSHRADSYSQLQTDLSFGLSFLKVIAIRIAPDCNHDYLIADRHELIPGLAVVLSSPVGQLNFVT